MKISMTNLIYNILDEICIKFIILIKITLQKVIKKEEE